MNAHRHLVSKAVHRCVKDLFAVFFLRWTLGAKLSSFWFEKSCQLSAKHVCIDSFYAGSRVFGDSGVVFAEGILAYELMAGHPPFEYLAFKQRLANFFSHLALLGMSRPLFFKVFECLQCFQQCFQQCFIIFIWEVH